MNTLYPVYTLLPASRLRLTDCIAAAHALGQKLYQRRGTLIASHAKPGPAWHRVGILPP